LKNKKGQALAGVPTLVVSFVLIGLVVAVSVVVLDKFATTLLVETSILNQTFTNGSALTNTPVVSASAVYCNKTFALASANWSLSGDIITVLSTEAKGCTTYSADYIYDADTKSTTALDNTVTSVSGITTDWLPILVIVAIVGVLLALIMGAFSFYRNR
jgi:hypothetical protein